MRWIHRCICMALGTLLGCCGDDTVTPNPEPEYGVPVAKLDIDGRVTMMGTGLAIPDIEVRLAGVDTVQTDAQGDWSMVHYGIDPETVALETLHFVDVDGFANLGLFLPEAHDLDTANIAGGVYIEHDIFTLLWDGAADYGPPPATLKSRK
ncbi:hypothetical protein H8E07_12665 [bacterium]|nr:hypothetical protein [bacterium]